MFFKCRLFEQLQSKREDLFLLKNKKKSLFVHYFKIYTWPLVAVSHTHHPQLLLKKYIGTHRVSKRFGEKIAMLMMNVWFWDWVKKIASLHWVSRRQIFHIYSIDIIGFQVLWCLEVKKGLVFRWFDKSLCFISNYTLVSLSHHSQISFLF